MFLRSTSRLYLLHSQEQLMMNESVYRHDRRDPEIWTMLTVKTAATDPGHLNSILPQARSLSCGSETLVYQHNLCLHVLAEGNSPWWPWTLVQFPGPWHLSAFVTGRM